MQLRRLHPEPGPVDPAALFDEVDLAALAPADRPYVVVNMVSSVDGRATVDGRSGPLGGPADKAVFFELRASVDAVLAGTGTLRAEGYRRLVRKPERQEQRARRGLEREPVALVLSRSGDVPDVPLLTDPEARPVVLTGEDAEPRRALARVRAEHGVRSLLCEGGPSLNAALLAAGLVDELFLTVSPLLAATADPLTIVGGAGLDALVPLELVWALEGDGMLLLRYAVAHGIKTTAGVVTSAAIVMVAVFAIFGTLSFIDMKQMGVGLAAAVLIDATIIRGVMLPAAMKLLGDWNWYLPRVIARRLPQPARATA